MARRPDVKLIVIDSLSGGQPSARENDSPGADAIRWLARLAKEVDKPVLVIHHLRKRSQQAEYKAPTIEDLQGVHFTECPAESERRPILKSQRARARKLLSERLASGPVLSTDLQQLAESAGISWDTFERAGNELGVTKPRDGHTGKRYWKLPSKEDPTAEPS
jgi:hypothetical protein